MSNYQYLQLLQMLSEISEELDGQAPACDFSEDVQDYEIDENYSQLWGDR